MIYTHSVWSVNGFTVTLVHTHGVNCARLLQIPDINFAASSHEDWDADGKRGKEKKEEGK